MNWCKCHTDRNLEEVMLLDKLKLYLKLQEEWDGEKTNSMWYQGSSIIIRLIAGEHFN